MPNAFDRFMSAVLSVGKPMPKANPYEEQGTSGTAVIGGTIQTKEKSSKLFGPQRYVTASDMVCNISIVAAGIRYFLNLLAKPKWTVEPADESDEAKVLAEFVEEVMDQMDTTWPRVIRRAGLYKFHGFGIHEWTAKKRDDGKIGMLDVEVRPCHTILRWNVDEKGTVLGAWQTSPQTGRELGLPRSKIIYLVDDTLTDSPEGMGWFRHLVDPSERMAKYLQLEGYGFQRDLSGTPIGRAPLTELNKMVTAKKITQAQANAMLTGMEDFVKLQAKKADTGFLMDSQMFESQNADGVNVSAAPQWGLELLTGTVTSIDKIDKAIVRVVHDMAYIIGCENLLLGADGKGSLALSKDKSNNLYLNIESALVDMAAGFTKDYIGPIWMLNGFPDELKPKLKTEAVAFKDVEQITAALRDMATAGGSLQPDDPVIDEVRDLMGVSHQPELDPELLGMARRTALGAPPTDQLPPDQQGLDQQGSAPPGQKKKPAKKRRG